MNLEELLALAAEGTDEAHGTLGSYVSSYGDLESRASSADAKIAELEATNAELSTVIAQVKSHNYDLLTAATAAASPAAEAVADEVTDEDDTPSLEALLSGSNDDDKDDD